MYSHRLSPKVIQGLALAGILACLATSASALSCARPDLAAALEQHSTQPGAEVLVGALNDLRRRADGDYVARLDAGPTNVVVPDPSGWAGIAGAPDPAARTAWVADGREHILLVNRSGPDEVILWLGPCAGSVAFVASADNLTTLGSCAEAICGRF